MPTQYLGVRFYRRPDLTTEVRLRIASIALYFSVHGTISRLSDKYNVSRQFIYDLSAQFEACGKACFDARPTFDIPQDKLLSLQWILSLRLEGKSPIEGISSILKRFNIPYNSVGLISQELQRIGLKQGNILTSGSAVVRLVFCCDEVFSKGQAILITVDPLSMCILQIDLSANRKGESWSAHWSRLLGEGYVPLCLCNDEGLGMSSAQKDVLPGTVRQSDTFHAVAHRLGTWVERLETKAFKAIEAEYACLQLWETSKTAAVWDKRGQAYAQAQQKAQQAIALSDTFVFLYHCLLSSFHIFDNKGRLKEIDRTLEDFDTALDLIKTLAHQDINKEIKSIENCKSDLFNFMSVAQQTVNTLAQQVPMDILKDLCLAWQTHKNAIKAKQTDRKNALKRKEKYILKQLKEGNQTDKIEAYKDLVYAELNKIVQSSAAVECINSILRPYLNTSKNQISQAALNLFMAYHNHRRFKAGERKGKTPFEILTGEKQEKDWLELMLLKAA
jgi:tetratricopeptide (TPR) repeat protein